MTDLNSKTVKYHKDGKNQPQNRRKDAVSGLPSDFGTDKEFSIFCPWFDIVRLGGILFQQKTKSERIDCKEQKTEI